MPMYHVVRAIEKCIDYQYYRNSLVGPNYRRVGCAVLCCRTRKGQKTIETTDLRHTIIVPPTHS